MAPFQLLLAGAVACGGVATLSAYAAWPKLRALEARGVVKTTVPDLLAGRTNSWKAGKLIWFTPIPADRKRLRRLLMICRTAQVGALVLFVMGLATTQGADVPRGRGGISTSVAPVILAEPAN